LLITINLNANLIFDIICAGYHEIVSDIVTWS